jgi:hypothetical protein
LQPGDKIPGTPIAGPKIAPDKYQTVRLHRNGSSCVVE